MNDLLSVRDLKVELTVRGEQIRAVDGVSFRIRPGGTTALVGESGSGKSVCSQAIMGILPNIGSVAGGEILFTDPNGDGETIDPAKLDRDGPKLRSIRGGRVSMIFQEPMTSLSPLHTIGDQISEALHLHRKVDKPAGHDRHGAGLPTGPAHCRRADHRPRCDNPGPNSQADQGFAIRAAHDRADDHP